MMDRMDDRACSDCVLERPVLVAMADTNSAFLKLMTSSEAEVAGDDFFLDDFLVLLDFFLAA